MTFDESSAETAARSNARAYARQLLGEAAAIDRTNSISEDMTRAVVALTAGDPFAMVLTVEEIAQVSAALATKAVATTGGPALSVAGLRGATTLEASEKAQLVLAGVALGIGQAAVDAALVALRQSTATPRADVEKPHWVVADVATELDAARLLVYKAARSNGEADIAMARLMATAAAGRAVDAAVRVVGAEAMQEGSVLERLVRDVRALSVLLGTEEDHRAVAAEALFPR